MFLFPELSSAWGKSQALVASRLILKDSEHWPVTVQHTSVCWRVDIHWLHNQAMALATDYVRQKTTEVELEATVVEIPLSSFTLPKPPRWSLPKLSKSRVGGCVHP